MQLGVSRQTLDSFIAEPFGKNRQVKNLDYEIRYQKYKKENKIRIAAVLELEKNYFVHLKVPSESQKNLAYYDVVIQFFTPDEKIQRQMTVVNYYVQFFSNSPGFVYKYASLYKVEGYLIEALMDKYKPGMLDIMPDHTNKNYDLYFDSSIYYACRFLQEHKMTLLGKFNLKIYQRYNATRFFEGIQDAESAEINRNVAGLENKVIKEIHKDTQASKVLENKLKNSKNPLFRRQFENIHKKKTASMSTMKDSPSRIITAKKSTSKQPMTNIKRAKKSTKKS